MLCYIGYEKKIKKIFCLNKHFYFKVLNTPQENRFLNILQHLLRIETKDVISDVMWSTAETLVHRSSLIENQEDANKLLRTQNFPKAACPHCRVDMVSQRKSSLSQNEDNNIKTTNQQTSPDNIPPPPPPPMMPIPQISVLHHPTSHSSLPGHTSNHNNLPIPPPPPPNESQRASPINKNMIASDKRSKTPEISSQTFKALPQQETPIPRTKMKTINWNKIP